jgi:hypothetical protein
MAHIFFEELENRKSTQTIFTSGGTFANWSGSTYQATPPANFYGVYGLSTPSYTPINLGWPSQKYPINIPYAIYGISPSPWPLEFPDWQNPFNPIDIIRPLYGINPSPIWPIDKIDIPRPLYGISPSPWPIQAPVWPVWQNPVYPNDPPVLLYGIFLPSDTTSVIPDLQPPDYPIAPIVAYYGAPIPYPISIYPDITSPVDDVPVNTLPKKIDDWLYPIKKPKQNNPGWQNPITVKPDPPIIPIEPPRIYPLYGIQLQDTGLLY